MPFSLRVYYFWAGYIYPLGFVRIWYGMVCFGVLLGYGWNILALDLLMSFGMGPTRSLAHPLYPFSFYFFSDKSLPPSLLMSVDNLRLGSDDSP